MELKRKYNKKAEQYLMLHFILAVLLLLVLIGCGIAFCHNTDGNLTATIAAIFLFVLVSIAGKKLLNIKREDVPRLMPNGWEWGICILLFALVFYLSHLFSLPKTLLSNIPLSILCLLFALPCFRIFRKLRKEHQN